ncbi:MAG: 3-phosphoshikimate 1-carboxyvinyltransferase [Campylobacterota bacterium]|nr:3-phosphoshikimate 1-carboxyvinyltransferase [Campylobacterota bacterium]
MKNLQVLKAKSSFSQEIDSIASDKSISHRCAMFSLLSSAECEVENFLEAEDTLNSLKIAQELGAVVKKENNKYFITPPKKIKEPSDVLDCGNAGTGIRLYCGLLAGSDGFFVLSGDKYLRSRPMKRVIKPLCDIGAKIDARDNANLAPIAIRGASLKAFTYESAISSAQVKSAMILAALGADGVCRYKESELSRDHTERMLRGMGVKIEKSGDFIEIHPVKEPLKPLKIKVPTDPSSAFFFAVAAAIVPNSKVLLKNLTLNPTRIEAFKVLKKMGAKIEFVEKENIYEPIGDILVEYAPLKSVEVSENISWLIDELPALSIAMAFASGTSIVRNAKELRVKESDRIESVAKNLRIAGVEVTTVEDGYSVMGTTPRGAVFDSFGDHRIAMSFALLAMASSESTIKDIDCISTSFPNFIELLSKMTETKIYGS